ncbi:MAG TPA: hypothetical protein VHF67_13000 [Gaiellaceae bacterium]|nr:hypothetical protein [Gaiellaceae bacterium]
MTPALAHGVGSVQDLPVPQWLFLYGAGVVLIASFAALAVLWRRPLLETYDGGRPFPGALQRVLLSQALRVALGALAVALLALVFATALVGERSPVGNLAPTFVYVVFWLGLVPVVVVLGNVWPVLNPWKATADAAEWTAGRLGARAEAIEYPERLGRWPAAVLLFLFAALELAYFDPADPRALALAIALYSGATWIGALVFGSRAWFGRGDGFSVYFDLLSRMAPFAAIERDGRQELVLRPPFVGLASLRNPAAGTIGVVAVMLGSVGFDGFSRTAWWRDRVLALGDVQGTLIALVGLAIAVAAVAAVYIAAVSIARALAGGGRALAGAFVGSLVPIALVYAVSHYFSLLVIQGQFTVPLASDPFGWGWDLFGGSDFRPNLAPFDPNTIWYVQVGTLVAGHVIGLALAHDRAIALFPSASRALRTQYPLLVLMVAYTVGGLWLLSQD